MAFASPVNEYPNVPPALERLFPANPVFFVTACTHRRRPLHATDSIHNVFVRFTRRAYDEHGIAVGRYVIMPDHIHLFVCGPNHFELGRWVGMLKQCLEKALAATASPTGRRLQKNRCIAPLL
jgi:REP element-mobilizing transposase RayT